MNLNIIQDPFGGLYSGGQYIAFEETEEITLPDYVLSDCDEFENEQFWNRYSTDPDFYWFNKLIISGNSVDEVIDKFKKKKELD